MNNADIRWQQRFINFQKALLQLQSAVELSKQRTLSPLEKQYVIQAFEFTHELAWNILKVFSRIRKIKISILKRRAPYSIQG